MGGCLAHPWEWGSCKNTHCILPASSAPRETTLTVTENCRVLHVCLFHKFSSTSAGSPVVRGTPDGEQLHVVAYTGSALTIAVLKKPARCKIAHTSLMAFPKSPTTASCNDRVCVEGKKPNIVIDYLVQKKEENCHRWWWQMWQPRILGKIWSIFDYWSGCFYGVDSSTSSKPFQQ